MFPLITGCSNLKKVGRGSTLESDQGWGAEEEEGQMEDDELGESLKTSQKRQP